MIKKLTLHLILDGYTELTDKKKTRILMTYLHPVPFYVLGILTYYAWTKLKQELNRGQGGEIERIIRLDIK